MMSFLFNFPNPNCENNEKAQEEENVSKETVIAKQCHEICSTSVKSEVSPVPVVQHKVSESVCLQYLDSQCIETRLTSSGQSAISQAVEGHSDLVPDIYEGGLKVWEGSVDLVQYLNQCSFNFNEKCVLDLGCGAGLPGLLALIQGAAQVHFQDYNDEVIQHYTIPNVRLNQHPDTPGSCRFFSGDWLNFVEKVSEDDTKYDVILSAETIYQPTNYKKLMTVFQKTLSHEGIVMIAAKSNYFGVGGGTRDFEAFIHREGLFHVSPCHVIEEGVPREILKLTWKQT